MLFSSAFSFRWFCMSSPAFSASSLYGLRLISLRDVTVVRFRFYWTFLFRRLTSLQKAPIIHDMCASEAACAASCNVTRVSVLRIPIGRTTALLVSLYSFRGRSKCSCGICSYFCRYILDSKFWSVLCWNIYPAPLPVRSCELCTM